MRQTISAGGVLINDQQRVLFCHPTNAAWNSWLMPKGQVEEGENIEDAALREVLEETGWNCSIIAFLSTQPQFKSKYYFPDHSKETPHTEPALKILKFFLMQPLEQIKEHDWEHDKFLWIKPEKIHLYASDRELPIIQEALTKYLELFNNAKIKSN